MIPLNGMAVSRVYKLLLTEHPVLSPGLHALFFNLSICAKILAPPRITHAIKWRLRRLAIQSRNDPSIQDLLGPASPSPSPSTSSATLSRLAPVPFALAPPTFPLTLPTKVALRLLSRPFNGSSPSRSPSPKFKSPLAIECRFGPAAPAEGVRVSTSPVAFRRNLVERRRNGEEGVGRRNESATMALRLLLNGLV